MAELAFHPVTPERWDDLERLFGPHGAYSNCWCMWWRLTRAEFDAQSGAQKRAGLRAIVDAGRVPGILAYAGDEPVAWCSVAPRPEYASLERSRTLRRIDDQPVWSITCFVVAKKHRHQGLQAKLIAAAVAYAGEQGATIVEAYPDAQPAQRLVGSAGYMGSAATFARAGFVEVARPSQYRVIMRYYAAAAA